MPHLRQRSSTRAEHVESLGHRFESSVRIEYLKPLKKPYDSWFERYDRGPKMIDDIGEHDLVLEKEDRRDVIVRVGSRHFGLFPE